MEKVMVPCPRCRKPRPLAASTLKKQNEPGRKDAVCRKCARLAVSDLRRTQWVNTRRHCAICGAEFWPTEGMTYKRWMAVKNCPAHRGEHVKVASRVKARVPRFPEHDEKPLCVDGSRAHHWVLDQQDWGTCLRCGASWQHRKDSEGWDQISLVQEEAQDVRERV